VLQELAKLRAKNMPSILSEEDKETVKRQVPKQSNKIQAVAVARLYIAYPNRQKWMYTGLQGAVVLANDLVGNTYWLKLVDVSVRIPLRGSPTANSVTLLILYRSLRIEGLYGTRRSMIHGHTTRTELFSTLSKPKSTWRGCHLWTRGKPRHF
jgi:hypothetical protein